MISSKASLYAFAVLLLSLWLAGCATQQSDRELKMPGWFEGFDEEEKAEAEDEQPGEAPESAADASDRIRAEEPDTAAPESAESAPAGDQEIPDESGEPDADKEQEPAPDTADAPTSDTLKLPPRPEQRAAENQEQALAAQQARARWDQALKKLKAGQLNDALLLFQELAAEYPSLSGPIVNQAIILRKQDKLEQAKSLLQNALLNKVQNPYLMNELGLVHRQLGNFAAAKQAYLSAIRMEPNYDKAHYNLAVLADLYLHDPALAFVEFEAYQALQVEPDKKVAGWLKEIERRIR